MLTELATWLDYRQSNLQHRQLLVVSGSSSIQHDTLNLIADKQTNASVLLVTQDADYREWFHTPFPDQKQIVPSDYQQVLGEEFSLVIYDSRAGLHASALQAVSGTITQQGLFILLCPEFSCWPDISDLRANALCSYGNAVKENGYAIWLINALKADEDVAIIEQSQIRLPITTTPDGREKATSPPYRTKEQADLVNGICDVISRTDSSIHVIKANRGRGKSYALGLISAKLSLAMSETESQSKSTSDTFSNTNIVVTAPAPRATKSVFTAIADTGSLRFVAPDALVQKDEQIDILLIDEAAAIPANMLQQLVKRASHVVFSTTVDGYEGSGRGFELRFEAYLDSQFPGWHSHYLKEPIRWFSKDCLEGFWDNAHLTARGSVFTEDSDQLTPAFTLLTGNELRKDPLLLRDVFTLLVEAHYQTTPDDLQRLLIADDMYIAVLRDTNKLIACATINVEGGNKLKDVAIESAAGKRRVNGHLSAQGLAYQYALPEAAILKYWRIVRIAVQPELQQRGMGKELLNAIEHTALKRDVECLSTSFGLTLALARFWRSADFELVKVGLKRDKSSGEHSGLFIKPISERS